MQTLILGISHVFLKISLKKKKKKRTKKGKGMEAPKGYFLWMEKGVGKRECANPTCWSVREEKTGVGCLSGSKWET